MTTLESTSLPIDVPDLAATVADELDPALAYDGLPPDLTWWLGARRVHAEFDATRGLTAARFGTGAGVAGLTWSDLEVERADASPRAVRFTRGGGRVVETLRIPERLPGLVVELRLDGAATLRGQLHIGLPEGAGCTAGDAGVRWFEAGEGDGLLVVALGPEGRIQALGEPRTEEGGVVLPLEIEGDQATLLILAGEPASASLRSLAAVAAHGRRAAPAKEALRLREPMGEAARTLEWAWTRVRDRHLEGVGSTPARDPDQDDVWVRTAVAAGLADAARAVLAAEPVALSEADAWEAWAAAVGAGGPIDALERRIGGGEDLSSAVRQRLAEVADRVSADTWAADLRATEAAQAGRVSLPSFGTAQAEGDDVAGEPAARVDPEAWVERLAADPAALEAEGWHLLRDLVEDILGWSPDADTARMHLSPSLPDSWPRFALEGLRGGELKMRLERIRSGGVDQWRFEPMAGAVPATLILRLPVPDRDTQVEVDGVPAELDYDDSDGTLRVPIQLQLDQERVVRVGGAPEPDPGTKRRISLPTI